jgi:hypothetical protein
MTHLMWLSENSTFRNFDFRSPRADVGSGPFSEVIGTPFFVATNASNGIENHESDGTNDPAFDFNFDGSVSGSDLL